MGRDPTKRCRHVVVIEVVEDFPGGAQRRFESNGQVLRKALHSSIFACRRTMTEPNGSPRGTAWLDSHRCDAILANHIRPGRTMTRNGIILVLR
jgi:hypothetical protein